MLLVVVPMLESEWPVWRTSLACSLGRFFKAFGDEVSFFIVVQGKSGDRIDPQALDLADARLEILYTDLLSVSAARNRGLAYARQGNFDSIVFHDVSLTYLPPACVFFRDHHRGGLLRCGLSFASQEAEASVSPACQYTACTGKLGRGHGTYVWAYCFPVHTIEVEFDERYGPGESTRYNCGEDVLFLREYLASCGLAKETVMLGVGVMHPPRPVDFSKHLAYAYGQGHLCRELLRRDSSPSALVRALAFFGNAVLRVILLRPRALDILKLRIAGFFSVDSLGSG